MTQIEVEDVDVVVNEVRDEALAAFIQGPQTPERDISSMIYSRVFELIPFISSYLDLKPQMLLQESHTRFRIVVQCFSFRGGTRDGSGFGTSECPSIQQQFNDLKQLIELLKNLYSKLLVLLYTNQPMNETYRQQLNFLRMKYPRLYWTSDLAQVKLFCAMAPISQIKLLS